MNMLQNINKFVPHTIHVATTMKELSKKRHSQETAYISDCFKNIYISRL